MPNQTGRTRRRFLELSGAALGGIAVGTTVTAAERTDRFIVDVKNQRKLERSDLTIVHDLTPVGLAVVSGAESAAEEVGTVAPDVEVELDEPESNDAAPQAESATDEPLYDRQWDKQVQEIPAVHEITRGEGTRVSIIDSGVLESHPDLARALSVEKSLNFTDDGRDHNPVGSDHGTHVAGIVAADDRNEDGVVGTAPDTELIDCRVFSGPSATFADILAAIVYSAADTDERLVVNGEEVNGVNADAANLSLGAYPIPRQGLGSFYGKVLNSTMTYANRKGTLLVIAAGNDSANLQKDKNLISLPNEGAQALSVSATGPVGFRWDASEVGDAEAPPTSPAIYTNYGTNAVTVGAPGGDIAPTVYEELIDGDEEPVPDVPWFYDLVLNTVFEVTATDDDGLATDYKPGYGWKAGTSMAAPQVAGAAALVKSANPDYNANQVESTLKRTAEVPDGYDKAYYGSGFVDVLDAVRE